MMNEYNPDGKEVIARDNEISLLRKEDMSKAYFSCHTDITVPYSELGDIVAVGKDGSRITLIRQGRFALEGTQGLNEASWFSNFFLHKNVHYFTLVKNSRFRV